MFEVASRMRPVNSVRRVNSVKRRLLLWPAVFHFILLGCGSPGTAPTVPVEGTLLHNGKPATAARIVFTPASGRPAVGNTDEQGRFTLSTFAPDDGAVAGAHKVTVSDLKRNWNQDPSVSRFPALYERHDTTPLVVEVKPDGANEFTFDMTK